MWPYEKYRVSFWASTAREVLISWRMSSSKSLRHFAERCTWGIGWGWRNKACLAWRRERLCGRLAGAFSYPSREVLWRRQRQAALRCVQGKDRKQKPQFAVRESPVEHRKPLLAPPSLESCKTQLGPWANINNLAFQKEVVLRDLWSSLLT